MRALPMLSASLILALSAGAAFAGPAEDAAYDKHKQTVIDTRGNCVRTKWQDAADPCAPPAPAPKPVPVAKPAPAPVLPTVSLEQRTIYFDFDSATITPVASAKLDQLAAIINDSVAITDVRVHGFTDQFGTDKYNNALAARRADAVKSYLDGHSRLRGTADVQGLGKSAPESSCESVKGRDAKIACMATERRVEVEFKAEK